MIYRKLNHWTHEHDSELYDSINRKATGIKARIWGGWTWTSTDAEYGKAREFRTDGEGCGLWSRNADGTWGQIEGTSQFSLPRDRQATIRKLDRRGIGPDKDIINA